jgi:hypothetical protein
MSPKQSSTHHCEAGREVSANSDSQSPLHWEEIAPGRFQPRRTRGSYPGRELG